MKGYDSWKLATPPEYEEACPGDGACHGCVVWCDRCGDVGDTCNASRCDVHRCQECNEIRRPQDRDHWTYVCEVCEAPDPVAMLAMYRETARDLAHNLAVGAALCEAFEEGWEQCEHNRLYAAHGYRMEQVWKPGCGRGLGGREE
jgi:hypothetical protein